MKQMMVKVMACLFVASACGSEPEEKVFGTFALAAVQGSLLPYHDPEKSDADCDAFITEGELVLQPSGGFTLEFSGPRTCTGGEQPVTMGRVYSGTASQSGGQLTFTVATATPGGGTIQFAGTVNPLEAIVTVPPIPPATGSNLLLQFAAVR